MVTLQLMPKVSVIVPVYNVERYIERCAMSLFKQTLNDVEYIFIDDCTPDDSMSVLQTVIEKFQSRFTKEKKIVKIESMPTNSGLAAVRRHGMNIATGDFIIHCDSDDWVDTELYEKMYCEAIRSGADVVKCPIRDEYKDWGITRRYHQIPLSCKEVVRNWWCDSEGMFCWNKLVRKSIYTDNDFQPFYGINMWEDNGLMLRVFYYANGFSQIDGPVYHYNQTNTSAITSGYSRDKINQMIKCATYLEEFFESKHDADNYKKTVLTLKYLAKLNLVTSRYDWLKEFYTLFPESNVAASWIKMNAFSKKGKIRFWFVKHHLAWLFVAMFKAKNILSKMAKI